MTWKCPLPAPHGPHLHRRLGEAEVRECPGVTGTPLDTHGPIVAHNPETDTYELFDGTRITAEALHHYGVLRDSERR